MNHVKRIAKPIALIVSILGLSGIALAQQQQCKVAIVRMYDVIHGSDEGRSQNPKYDARLAQWQAKVYAIQRELNAASAKLKGENEKLNRALSQAEISELNNTIIVKGKELRQVSSDAQSDVDAYDELLYGPIRKAASEIAKEVAAEKGTDTVIDASSLKAALPASSEGNCNITSEVTERVNAKLKTASPTK